MYACSPLLYASPGLVYSPDTAGQSHNFPAAEIKDRMASLASRSGKCHFPVCFCTPVPLRGQNSWVAGHFVERLA